MPWSEIFCVILGILAILLGLKLYFMRKSIAEIREGFTDKLEHDTNTLISVSSGDRQINLLAEQLNGQLRQLRRERRRFQTGDRELKEAVTNISHDLRTPLTAICGYLELLQREPERDKTQRYLSQIEERTQVMKQLTEELFRYSIVRTREKFTPEKVDLCRILEDNLLSFYGIMQEKQIVPEIALPEDPVWRMLDRAALDRIFSNILSNAVKYSQGDLAVELKEDGTILFSNGAKGLTAVEVGRLFDRFYTVESGQSATGLGLSIAKGLTEQCGGEISAQYAHDRLSIIVKFP